MSVKVEVTDTDIDYAERILLPTGKVFDSERRDFIKNLDTIDLQAVPGSGKTTALLAKLLILDRKLPFADGSGILVISHTNTAVDEIKSKIGKHCSELFSYPNYVGTIQSFVDKFLCIPYYTNHYKRRINRIDDQLHAEYVSNYHQRNLSNFTSQEQKNAKHFLRGNDGLVNKLRMNNVDDGKWVLRNEMNGAEVVVKKPKGNTRPKNYIDWTTEEKDRIKNWCIGLKKNQFQCGILCYDDAYTFGELMITSFPRVLKILQTRFKYVFVDEMQDMAPHQYGILEKLFFDNGTSSSCYQRIGDKNQAIYDKKDFSDAWEDRTKILSLNGSHRLSAPIAGLVSKFAVSPIIINGNGKNQDDTEIDIKPHIIVYDDSSLCNVINAFTDIISELLRDGKIPVSQSNKYVAIGSRHEHHEAGRFAIKDYCPSYIGKPAKGRIDYDSLSDYLVAAETDETHIDMGTVRNQIINGLLRVLRTESIVDTDGRAFTKAKLFNYLENQDKNVIDNFRLLLYQWSRDVVKGLSIIDSVKSYLPEFMGLFGKNTDISANKFINAPSTKPLEKTEMENTPLFENMVTHNGINVDVSTIHSVKGRTHTATLLLETYYQKKYESERLRPQFSGSNNDCNGLTGWNRETAKKVYVGFSRPTHLLAFAVHKSRFATLGINAPDSTWEIRDISR